MCSEAVCSEGRHTSCCIWYYCVQKGEKGPQPWPWPLNKGVERLSPYYYYYYPLRWKQEEAATASIAQRSSDGAMRTASEVWGSRGKLRRALLWLVISRG